MNGKKNLYVLNYRVNVCFMYLFVNVYEWSRIYCLLMWYYFFRKYMNDFGCYVVFLLVEICIICFI